MDRLLENKTSVRIIAVLLGILLWAVVRITGPAGTASTESLIRTQEFTNVSITTIGLNSAQFAIQSIQPEKVRIRVIGRESSLNRINPKNYQIQLDLSNVGKGEHTLALKAFGFPAGVDVEIDPPTVTVQIEEKVIKEIPITLEVTGTPSEGHKAGQAIIKPNRVNVTVPSSLADQVAAVVGKVDVEGASTAVVKQVKLAALDKNGKEMDVAIMPAVADVEVPITSPFETVPLQVKLKGTLPPGLAIGGYRQNVDKVTVYGKQSILDKFEFYPGPEIDLSQITGSVNLKLDIPVQQSIQKLEPAQVEVELVIVPAATKVLESVPITISGQNDAYTVKVVSPDTGKLPVTIEGAPDILETVKAANVQAIADVSNLPPGRHEVMLDFNLPTYVKAVRAGVPRVVIDITAKEKNTTAPAQTPASNGTPGEAIPIEQPQAEAPQQEPAAAQPGAAAGGEGQAAEAGTTVEDRPSIAP
ncbi:CdaR family protein [Paenibacillus turpanensis]|uniref:CdaR family protein n=1 Tax=Paenibacillus turpanensis TaxID=2689078 RepID=UPI00140AF392|nr:CdaR family protein [Paenibacillus turpanensis]